MKVLENSNNETDIYRIQIKLFMGYRVHGKVYKVLKSFQKEKKK